MIDKYRAELQALLETYLWYRKLWLTDRTVGLECFRLKFYNGQTGNELSLLQKVSFLLPLALRYLRDKLQNDQKLTKTIDSTSTLLQTLNITNYIAFIYFGDYRSLNERIFQIKVGKENVQTIIPQSPTSNRELLWETMSRVLTFSIPIVSHWIDFGRLVDIVLNRVDSNYIEPGHCYLCRQKVVSGRTMAGCIHVYCYHCIMTRFISKGSFKCDLCNVSIESPSKLCDRLQH